MNEHFDVIIVGGAFTGASVAWWLASNPDFDGSILVVERDLSFRRAATSLSNSCIRQQFSHPLNIQIGLFGVEFIRSFADRVGESLRAADQHDLADEIPDVFFHNFGYLYLADSAEAAADLLAKQKLQVAHGARTEHLDAEMIAARWPFLATDDLVAGNHNPYDEGYFDSGTMFEWWRRAGRQLGVATIPDELIDIDPDAGRVTLASGRSFSCGTIVNAAGTRARQIARLAGIELPVEARKRYTFVFRSAQPLGADLPLVIDPSGVHVRQDGEAFMCGVAPDDDRAVELDDFTVDREIFNDKVWPVLARRVPAFERLKVIAAWAGHYAFNVLDHNVVVGAHPDRPNFVFANGFSGHGLQQSPAVGRAVAELITYGEYRTLDLTALGYDRIRRREPFREHNVI